MLKRSADLAVLSACAVILIAALLPNTEISTVGLADEAPPPAAAQDGTRRSPGPAEDEKVRKRHRQHLRSLSNPAPEQNDGLRQLRASPITSDMLDRIVAIAAEVDPAMAERLREQQRKDPQKLAALISAQGGRLLELLRLRERDPELFELKVEELRVDTQVTQTAREIRAAKEAGRSEAEIEPLVNQLRVLVEIQMGFAIRARQDYICRLQEQIEQLEQTVQHNLAHFDELVENRLEELTHPPPE